MTYKTAAAFRRALTDRLNRQAQAEGSNITRLMKRVAFERFLARLFLSRSGRWVLKGGYALELRLGDRARTTKDLDLAVPPPPSDSLLEELQAVAEHDLEDFFRFRVSQMRGELAGPPLGGYRFRVEALLDGRSYTAFPLDIGQGDVTTGAPERALGNVDLGFAGIARPELVIYPLVDHFADKLHAYTTPRENPSRVKDLVDMLLLLELGLTASSELKESIEATFERYERHVFPDALPKPPPTWQKAFGRLAEEVNLADTNLDEAFTTVETFLIDSDLLNR